MPEYVLTYFQVRGKAEHIRYIFHQAGVNYEEDFVTEGQWPALKPSTPFGQLPLLKVDGKVLAQSAAIARYLANEFGLNGGSNYERALCDQFVDGVYCDLYPKYAPCYVLLFDQGGTMEKAKELFAKFKETELKVFLDRYEKFLATNGTGFLVGNKLTWADLTVAEFLERFESLWDPTVLQGHPNLAKLTRMVHELPGIKKYVATRPEMPPC